VAVQSIRTSIQVRDVAGDHLFVPAGEMSFGEMDGVRKLDHLTQEVWTRAEALENAGDLVSPGGSAPEIIGGSSFTGSFGIFIDSDFGNRSRDWWLGLRDFGLGVVVISCCHVCPLRHADLRRKSSYTGKPVAITRAPNAASRGLFTPIRTSSMTISNRNARGVNG
jgi:hypothetical protein